MNNEYLPGLTPKPKPPRTIKSREFKISVLRECTAENAIADVPEKAVAYWRTAVATSLNYNPDVECLAVLALNTRKRIIGHVIVATGTLDTILVHSREVFRPAIALNASAVLLIHGHPSGDHSPSEADIRVTRELIRAGQILKIELTDHIVVGHASFGKGYTSLREMGTFYN